jgi:hypothetical protein
MDHERQGDHCDICGVLTGDDSTICAECGSAFEPALLDEATDEKLRFDPAQYCWGMFPWEQSRNQPKLIISNRIWLILAVGLFVVVILLALIRAPLPSCWELL